MSRAPRNYDQRLTCHGRHETLNTELSLAGLRSWGRGPKSTERSEASCWAPSNQDLEPYTHSPGGASCRRLFPRLATWAEGWVKCCLNCLPKEINLLCHKQRATGKPVTHHVTPFVPDISLYLNSARLQQCSGSSACTPTHAPASMTSNRRLKRS